MRKARKKQAEDFLKLLGQAHEEVKRLVGKGETPAAMDLLGQCQEGAMKLGELIEKAEGQGALTIPLLESYCEVVFQIYQGLAKALEIHEGTVPKAGQEAIGKKLGEAFARIEESVQKDITVRFEIVFLPYKASMWDSMESVWQAADNDPSCDVSVVPVPYYDRGPDGQLGECHYEGGLFPPYVPITHYQEYPLGERRPDAIYIHNPYDYANLVTSVAPEYYSFLLKRYTDCLVYIPYYSTTGGMSEDQVSCPAYFYADYIIIQGEKYRKYFDPSLPAEKFVPLGSPKFDRILRMCQGPPKPPAPWKGKLEGKTVYFYNTSLGGMLGDTRRFLEKMNYVFQCFEGREADCLLWRPHPLLETSFGSVRKEYKPWFDSLKNEFIRKGIGIYDDTPDITNTISLCDAYIGDAGTSVTSLFGMAGKPLFILDNSIASVPGKEDWRGAVVRGFPVRNGVRDGVFCVEPDSWMVTQGNKLYRSQGNNGIFRHFCDLSDYVAGGYYEGPVLIDGKAYLYPISAQDILAIGGEGVEKQIPLKPMVEQYGAFYSAIAAGRYLFLIPRLYPSLVRYDTANGDVSYFDIDASLFTAMADDGVRCGAVGVKGKNLYLASPVDGRVLSVDVESGIQRVLEIPVNTGSGAMAMVSLPHGEDFWMLPFSGNVVVRWNPGTGEAREYPVSLEDFTCRHGVGGHECMERPWGSAALYKNHVYLAPFWGNMYIRLDQNTGEATRWDPPICQPEKEGNGYFAPWAKGYLDCIFEGGNIQEYRLFSVYDRKFYQVDFEANACREIRVAFDAGDLRGHEPGSAKQSQWLLYACQENAWNSLPDFLDGDITGAPFDKERQLEAYRKLTANSDGTSGVKIHRFIKGKL